MWYERAKEKCFSLLVSFRFVRNSLIFWCVLSHSKIIDVLASRENIIYAQYPCSTEFICICFLHLSHANPTTPLSQTHTSISNWILSISTTMGDNAIRSFILTSFKMSIKTFKKNKNSNDFTRMRNASILYAFYILWCKQLTMPSAVKTYPSFPKIISLYLSWTLFVVAAVSIDCHLMNTEFDVNLILFQRSEITAPTSHELICGEKTMSQNR